MPLRKHSYRDLDKYYETRREQMRRYAEHTGSGKYPPRPWNAADDQRVLSHQIPDRQLSNEIQRSVKAIQLRRCKLKKLIGNSPVKKSNVIG